MPQRLAALLALAVFGLAVLISRGSYTPAADEAARVSFQIATGPSDGTFFTIGQAMAGLISHPPGVGRCEISTVCGPSGVILSARTASGSFDNLTAVNNGLIDSALVQADMAQAAVKGRAPFRRPQRQLRAVAALFSEQVHLVVRANAAIAKVSDLAGKRVALGAPHSDSALTAREILYAFGVGPGAVRRIDSDDPAADLAAGKLDAFFVIAGAPSPLVAAALKSGKAKLLPIDGDAAQQLLKDDSQLAAGRIAAGAYPGTPETPTLATRAIWVVNARAPDSLIYGVVRALFNPANHAPLAASHPAAAEIGLGSAAQNLPLPLHSGAARYYREVGKL
jgi:hypothetical protein